VADRYNSEHCTACRLAKSELPDKIIYIKSEEDGRSTMSETSKIVNTTRN
jgi:hypothetical protein